MREPDAGPDSPPSHVLVIATLGAAERRTLLRRRVRRASVDPEPVPSPVITGRATVIDVGRPLSGEDQADAWLAAAGEEQLAADLVVVNRALHASRLAAADPYQHPVARHELLVARVGYGRGEEVADGLWTDARELVLPARRHRRRRILPSEARLAALLGGREHPLAGEELALRARLDLDHERSREAALQVLVALDATIAELAADPSSSALAARIDELRTLREPVDQAAQAALAGPLKDDALDTVELALSRIEAALRARTIGGA